MRPTSAPQATVRAAGRQRPGDPGDLPPAAAPTGVRRRGRPWPRAWPTGPPTGRPRRGCGPPVQPAGRARAARRPGPRSAGERVGGRGFTGSALPGCWRSDRGSGAAALVTLATPRPPGGDPGCAELSPRSSLVAVPTLETHHRNSSEEAIQAVAESSQGASPVRAAEQLPTTPSPRSAPTSGSSTRCTSSTSGTRTASTRPGGTSSSSTAPDGSGGTNGGRRPPSPASAAKAGNGRRDAGQARREAGRRSPRAARPQPSRPPKPARQAVRRRKPARGRTRRRSPATAGSPVPKEPEKRPPRPRPPTSRRYTVLRGAPARTVQNMDACLTVPDRDQRPLGAGQAALGQPHRHQQPPRPRPRRQGVVHPPDRLRAGQGAARRCRR